MHRPRLQSKAELRTPRQNRYALNLFIKVPIMLAAIGRRVMRWLYTLTMYVLTPIILWRLAWRGIHHREYFARWRERFGFFPFPKFDNCIWVHAVSLGEVNAAMPLIEALMKRFAGRQFVITTVTPTGSERVQKLYGDRVFHVYLPYDLAASVRRFLNRVNPTLAVIMETEIWPNLFLCCRERDIPIIVANARLSERSLKGYGPVTSLARMAIRSATWVAAQSPQDAQRLLRLGADESRMSIAGNVKYDMRVPQSLPKWVDQAKSTWGANRPVWIAASTHEAEEMPVLEAHMRVLRRFPDALMLIAPRHPERFKPTLQLCSQLGFRTLSRSGEQLAYADTQVFVVDTLGELLAFYAVCDVAFVAGSFARIGGHNVLEPAALGKSVLVGPNTFNFEEVTDLLISKHAAMRVEDANHLGEVIIRLLGDQALRSSMGEAALATCAQERGAVEKTMLLVDKIISGEIPKQSTRLYQR